MTDIFHKPIKPASRTILAHRRNEDIELKFLIQRYARDREEESAKAKRKFAADDLDQAMEEFKRAHL